VRNRLNWPMILSSLALLMCSGSALAQNTADDKPEKGPEQVSQPEDSSQAGHPPPPLLGPGEQGTVLTTDIAEDDSIKPLTGLPNPDIPTYPALFDPTSVPATSVPETPRAGPSPAPPGPPAIAGIGIAPGDILLGNIDNYPGHAGIFIGRWRDLPERVQQEYADVFNEVLIRSGDWGLADSYLVVDSMGDGVRVRSFVEQFTGYRPTGARRVYLENAAQWESQTGAAVAWPGLADDDPRRWAIVAEALEAARARVPYESGRMIEVPFMDDVDLTVHDQWPTAMFGLYDGVPYSQISVGLDCISLVHVVYWRGAGIDLDTSWAPWHTPEQIYSVAIERNLVRPVDLSHARFDALTLGNWSVEQTEVTLPYNQGDNQQLRDLLSVERAIYRIWTSAERLYFSFPADRAVDTGMWTQTGWEPQLQRNPDGTVGFTISTNNGRFFADGVFREGPLGSQYGATPGGTLRIEIRGDIRDQNSDTPLDLNEDGVADTQFYMLLEGVKIYGDMRPPSRRTEPVILHDF
jgi:hypothetical protein